MNKIRKEISKFKCQTTNEEIIFTVAYVEGNIDSEYKLKFQTLAIISGMHGSEFCSIEAIMKLLNELESNKLLINGKLIITNIFNLTAFKKNIDFNINNSNKTSFRLFEYRENENNAENINHYFWNEILKDVDFCIELHSGNMPISVANCIYVPIVGEQITDTISRNMAEVYNIKYIIDKEVGKNYEHKSAYSNLAFKAIPSILTGACSNESDTEIHYEGIKNIMTYIGMLKNEQLKYTEEKIILNYKGFLKSDVDGIWYPSVKTGDIVNKGDKVGEIKDYFGKKIKDIISPNDGIVCILKKNNHIKSNDPLVEINEIKNCVLK